MGKRLSHTTDCVCGHVTMPVWHACSPMFAIIMPCLVHVVCVCTSNFCHIHFVTVCNLHCVFCRANLTTFNNNPRISGVLLLMENSSSTYSGRDHLTVDSDVTLQELLLLEVLVLVLLEVLVLVLLEVLVLEVLVLVLLQVSFG